MNKNLFVFWTGTNAMPPVRQKCLSSLKNTEFNVLLVTKDNLSDFVRPEELHASFPYLNLAHRADYLRCFFMRRYGGGYSDLKESYCSWSRQYEYLRSSHSLFGIGYTEAGPHGIGEIYSSSIVLGESRLKNVAAWWKWRYLQFYYQRVIGLCAFILKKDSLFVEAWWKELNVRLDSLLPKLQQFPARYPKERPNHEYEGYISQYPVPWTYLLGDIFHPLALKYEQNLKRILPPPDFQRYQ